MQSTGKLLYQKNLLREAKELENGFGETWYYFIFCMSKNSGSHCQCTIPCGRIYTGYKAKLDQMDLWFEVGGFFLILI